MGIPFLKAHGTGNDFILLHHKDVVDLDRTTLAKQLCARHTGIGSDGLIVLEPDAECDYHMDFYNPDGSQSFCGNGSRCAFYAAHKWGMVQNEATFRAIDGTHEARFEGERIAVSMRNTGVPQLEDGHDFLHTGSPHAVLWVEEVSTSELNAHALPLRHDPRYAPGGTNVNLVALEGDGIAMRTFERGVEGETLSCGTGVTAAALVAAHRHGLTSPVAVQAPGGDLQVRFVAEPEGFAQIVLVGAVAEVYTGIVSRP